MNTLVKDACFRYPVPVLAGLGAYQVYGWASGARMFESVNAEGMCFTACVGYIGFMGWFARKVDDLRMEYEPSHEWRNWVISITVGIVSGVALRYLGVEGVIPHPFFTPTYTPSPASS